MEKEFSVAPMLDTTDRHCRAFLRLFSPRFRLYTEMIVVGSILHGDRDRLLGFDGSEHPLALQLGGCHPNELAMGSRIGVEYGYDEINLNIGCPSDRVKNARFGACLMASPRLVAQCVAAMAENVSVPVSVKTRLGIDDLDHYAHLCRFVELVSAAGCRKFIVHARKAWLNGLNPKENRTIPPLHYDRVYRLKQDFPHLRIVINGGISSVDEIALHLEKVDGVMIGREAYRNPWVLKTADNSFCGNSTGHPRDAVEDFPARVNIVKSYLPYIEAQLQKDVFLRHMTRHMFGVFYGQGGARSWRRYLSEHGSRKNAGIEVIEQALRLVHPVVRDPGPRHDPGDYGRIHSRMQSANPPRQFERQVWSGPLGM